MATRSTTRDPLQVKITFGRYRGDTVGDLATTNRRIEYMAWCVEKMRRTPYNVATLNAMEEVLKRFDIVFAPLEEPEPDPEAPRTRFIPED